jgi:hypothetical protein
VRSKAGSNPLALRNQVRAFRGTTSAGIIAIWLAISLAVIGCQAAWSALQSHRHSATVELYSDKLLRGQGSSTYLVVIVRNESSDIANDVRAFAQVGSHSPREASTTVTPSVLRIAPMQESVFVFDGFRDVKLEKIHFEFDIGSWSLPQLWKALPTVSYTYSHSAFRMVAINSNLFATQPATFVGVVFGPNGRIQGIGCKNIRGLRPSSTVNIDVRVRIGHVSGKQTTSVYEDG